MEKIYEVYRDRDSSKVGLYNGILKDSGIHTVVRNWHGSNIVEVPIPEFFPNICVLSKEDYEKSVEILKDYENSDSSGLEAWTCSQCGEIIDGGFSECWSCQASMDEKPEN